MGISARVGNTTSRPYLIEGRGITRSAPPGWRRPAQNAAWTCGQSGRGTTKGSASLPMCTCWTSWTCLVCGATVVDCNGGRRGRTTFKYVTGKVTITMRVGRLSTGAWSLGCKCTTPSIVFWGGFTLPVLLSINRRIRETSCMRDSCQKPNRWSCFHSSGCLCGLLHPKKKKNTHERCTCYAASLSAMVEPDSTFLRSSTCCSRWTEVCGEGFW